MDVEAFKTMMSMSPYRGIDTTKFENATELRNFKAQGMPDIKLISWLLKGNFFGASSNSKKNKPGNILYKGDHVWTLIGENNERFIFLMTKIDDSQCKMEYLTCFDCSESKDKQKYNAFLDEVDDKFANITDRWSDYLK
eukprot:gene9218-1305_t